MNTLPSSRLRVESVTIGYDRRVISHELSVAIPDESLTVPLGRDRPSGQP